MQLSVCATHTCWLRSWKMSSSYRRLPTLLKWTSGWVLGAGIAAAEKLHAAGRVSAGRARRKTVRSMMLRSHHSDCAQTTRLPEFTAESRVTRASPLSAPSVGARSWIHSLQTEINKSLRSPVWRQRHWNKRITLGAHVTWSKQSFTLKWQFSEGQTRRKKMFFIDMSIRD